MGSPTLVCGRLVEEAGTRRGVCVSSVLPRDAGAGGLGTTL